MNQFRTKSGRRVVAGMAAGLIVGLPLAAFFAAPSAHADNTPGANLAGINANAYATAMQFIPLVKGLVPAGNLSTGDFFQISVPYSASSSETGPSSSATATPIYPGPVATRLPGALQTLGFPAAFATLTTDPVITQAAYPPAPGDGASGTYNPPAGSTSGVGTSQANAAEGGASSSSNSNDTSFDNGLIKLGSSHTATSTTIAASAVSDMAEADVSHVNIMGLVDIASISSGATATSDGNQGVQTNSLKVGSVTVANQPAYIGPDGLHLAGTVNNLGLTDLFNSALSALQQAGISIKTISPNSTVNGAAASVDSGAVQISFIDPNIPSPQGDIPVNSVGTDVDLGLTHADAQATVYPPLPPITPIAPAAVTPISGSATVAPSSSAAPAISGAPSVATNSTGNSAPSTGAAPSYAPAQNQPTVSAQPASFIGMPTRMAWVVLSILISIVASGPLLGYANWQLLRGRKA